MISDFSVSKLSTWQPSLLVVMQIILMTAVTVGCHTNNHIFMKKKKIVFMTNKRASTLQFYDNRRLPCGLFVWQLTVMAAMWIIFKRKVLNQLKKPSWLVHTSFFFTLFLWWKTIRTSYIAIIGIKKGGGIALFPIPSKHSKILSLGLWQWTHKWP